MIKRGLIAILFILLGTLTLSAQKVKVSVGINGGALATQMLTTPEPSSPLYISGYGGAFASVHVGKYLSVRGAVNYALTGGKYEIANTPASATQSYIQIPFTLLVNAGRAVSFEVGLQQNILASSKFMEYGSSEVNINPDPAALKYNYGAVAGLCFNFGKMVFLNLRYCYGLSKSYVIYGVGYPTNTISAGLGFNLYTSRKSAFR